MNKSINIENISTTSKGIFKTDDEFASCENISKSERTNLISVIVPVLQEEKILDKILSKYMEYKKIFPFELIVSDGGSTDKTVEIAEKYADKVVVHKEKHKQTISEGRNMGAEIAEGEILVFINGDTVPSNFNNFFNSILDWKNRQSRFSDCDGLTCWVTIEKKELQFKDKLFYAIHNRYIKFLNLIGVGMGRGECQIISKDSFTRIGGYDQNLAAGEDFDLFRRLAKIGKIGFMSDIIVLESPRRFRKYGYLRVIFSWILNSVFVMIYGRSSSNDWEPVR